MMEIAACDQCPGLPVHVSAWEDADTVERSAAAAQKPVLFDIIEVRLVPEFILSTQPMIRSPGLVLLAIVKVGLAAVPAWDW